MRYLKIAYTAVFKIIAGLMTVLALTACTAHYTVNANITNVQADERYYLLNKAAAGEILLASEDFQRLVADLQ